MRRPGRTIWVHNQDFQKIRQIELNMAFIRSWTPHRSIICAKRELRIFNMLGENPPGKFPYDTNLGGPKHRNYEISHFSVARALKPPFKILRALRQRAIFKLIITCRGGPLEVIPLQDQFARTCPATQTENSDTFSNIQENPSNRIEFS